MVNKGFIFFDLQVQFAETIITMYIPATKKAIIFYNGLTVVDMNKVSYQLHSAIPETRNSIWVDQSMTVQHAGIPTRNQRYPVVQQLLFDSGMTAVTWDDSRFFHAIKQENPLGSPYYLRQALAEKAGLPTELNLLVMNRLNEGAAVKSGKQREYPTLEAQSLMAGLSIPVWPKLESDDQQSLTPASVGDLIVYSMQRAVNAAKLMQKKPYFSTFAVKKKLIEDYGLNNSASSTSSALSVQVLTNNGEVQYCDIPAVDLSIKVNGQLVNLIDRLADQQIISAPVVNFYRRLHGTSVRSKKELAAYYAQTGTRGVTVPYFDQDLKPVASFNRFSLGGGHGSALSTAPDGDFDMMIDQPNKAIIESTHAYSVDADSFFPNLAVILGIFSQGKADRYREILAKRLSIKHNLPADHNQWTDADQELNARQQAMKLVLNSALGAANTMSRRAGLDLDNRITSLRAIGNLIIYELGTAYVRQLQAHVVLTNTDGIKITFDHLPKQPTLEQIQNVAANVGDQYGLTFETKQLSRLLVKDTNNYLEWQNGTLTNVTGKLGKGYQGEVPLDSNVDHPIIVDMAVTKGISEVGINALSADWFQKFLVHYYQKHPSLAPWSITVRPTDKAVVVYGGNPLPGPGRFVFATTDNQTVGRMAGDSLRKIPGWPQKAALRVPDRSAFKDHTLDLNAYTEWCLNELHKYQDNMAQAINLHLDTVSTKKSKQSPATSELKKQADADFVQNGLANGLFSGTLKKLLS